MSEHFQDHLLWSALSLALAVLIAAIIETRGRRR